MPRSPFLNTDLWRLTTCTFGARCPVQRFVFAALFSGVIFSVPVMAQNVGDIDLDMQGGVVTSPANVPDLTTGADISPNTFDEREQVPVNVPELSAGSPALTKVIAINVPDLIIIGTPDPIDVVIDVPDLVIVGVPGPIELTIDVPDLIIVGRSEDAPNDLASHEQTITIAPTTAVQPETPPASGTDTDPDPQPLTQWCVGAFVAHIGQGMGTAVGFAMPFGSYMVSDARVTPHDCRNSLSFSVEGQTVLLSQGDAPRSYTGSLDLGDGAMRTLVLQCDEDLNLRGHLVTADQNLRIERPVWLIRKAQSPADIADCSEFPDD